MSRSARVLLGRLPCVLLLALGGCGGDVGTEQATQAGDVGASEGRPGQGSLPVEHGRLESPDGPLAWVRVGTGPALVVVHGGPGLDHRYLRPWVDALARGRSVVYYDRRGLGASVPDSAPLDSLAVGWDRTLEDLDALADRFAGEDGRVDLVAHSWGALPALAWALSRPGRVDALVLVSPVEPGSLFGAETRERQQALSDPSRRAVLDSLLALAPERRQEPSFRGEVLRAAFRVTAPDPGALDSLDLDLPATTAANGDVVARRMVGTAGSKTDLWAELGALARPVLVLHGSRDVGPPAMARALADSLPRGTAVVLEGVGHFPFVEAPDRFVEVVDRFLRGQGGA